jgi:hypothetical protein
MTKILFSDTHNTPLDVPDRTVNAETPLALYGSNSVNYGKDINTNLLKLLSNFADTTKPLNGVRGQLWFDTDKDKLKVNVGSDTYVELGYTKPPALPSNVILYSTLKTELSQYLPNVGNSTMRGALLLKDTLETDSESSAVTKAYVDSKAPVEKDDYIRLTGNASIATGPIYLTSDLISPNQAATKGYADATIPQVIISKAVDTAEALNIVKILPIKLNHIFGETTISSSNYIKSIDITGYGKIHATSCHVTIIGDDYGCTVSAKVRTTPELLTLDIIKHNSTSNDITVHYIIIGFTE